MVTIDHYYIRSVLIWQPFGGWVDSAFSVKNQHNLNITWYGESNLILSTCFLGSSKTCFTVSSAELAGNYNSVQFINHYHATRDSPPREFWQSRAFSNPKPTSLSEPALIISPSTSTLQCCEVEHRLGFHREGWLGYSEVFGAAISGRKTRRKTWESD